MRKLAALVIVLLLLPVYLPAGATPQGGNYTEDLQNNATLIYNFLENHSAELGIANKSLARIEGNLTLAENQSNETIKLQYLNRTIILELNVSASAIEEKQKFWANISSVLLNISPNCSNPVREVVANLTDFGGRIESIWESIRKSFNGTINATEVISALNKTLVTLSHSDEVSGETAECLLQEVERSRNQTFENLDGITAGINELMSKLGSLLKDANETENALNRVLSAAQSSAIESSKEKLENATEESLKLKGNLESLRNETAILKEHANGNYNTTMSKLGSAGDIEQILDVYSNFIETQKEISTNASGLKSKLEEFNGTYTSLNNELGEVKENTTNESRTLIMKKVSSLQERANSLYAALEAEKEKLQNISNISPIFQANVTALVEEINSTLTELKNRNSTLEGIQKNITSADLEGLTSYLEQIKGIESFLNGINESKVELKVNNLLKLMKSSSTTSTSTTTASPTTSSPIITTSSSTANSTTITNSTAPGKSTGGGLSSKVKNFLILLLKIIAVAVGAIAALIVGAKAYFILKEKSREREERKRIEEMERRKREKIREHQEMINLMKDSLSEIKKKLARLDLLNDDRVLEKLEELTKMIQDAERAFRVRDYRRVEHVRDAFAEEVEKLNTYLNEYRKTYELDLSSHVAANSYIGRRENNEDSYTAEKVGGNILLAVADGMGGHLAGEVASKKAIEILKETLESNKFGDPEEVLKEAILRANEEIYRMGHDPSHPELYKMGTTLTTAIVRGDTATIGNVGDSRTYLIRDGSIKRLTKDHSLVQELIDRGEITEEEARKHPQKNIITKALGVDEEIRLDPEDIKKVNLKPSDYLLLCSDGLSDALTDRDILNTVMNARSLRDAVKFLIEKAYSLGSNDNITVVLYRH